MTLYPVRIQMEVSFGITLMNPDLTIRKKAGWEGAKDDQKYRPLDVGNVRDCRGRV